MRCPCCGQDTDQIIAPEHLLKVVLPPVERRLLQALLDAYPHGLTRYEVALMTGMSPSHVSVALWSIRKKIRPYGWNVSGKQGSSLIPFYLEKYSNDQTQAQ